MGFPADWISAHYASHVLVGHLVKWNPNESQMTHLITFLIGWDVQMFLSKDPACPIGGGLNFVSQVVIHNPLGCM